MLEHSILARADAEPRPQSVSKRSVSRVSTRRRAPSGCLFSLSAFAVGLIATLSACGRTTSRLPIFAQRSGQPYAFEDQCTPSERLRGLDYGGSGGATRRSIGIGEGVRQLHRTMIERLFIGVVTGLSDPVNGAFSQKQQPEMEYRNFSKGLDSLKLTKLAADEPIVRAKLVQRMC